MIRSSGKRVRRQNPVTMTANPPRSRQAPGLVPTGAVPPDRRVDAMARAVHHTDHLAAIWVALDRSERGTFWVPTRALVAHAAKRGVTAKVGQPAGRGGRVMVASWADVPASRSWILVEHGAGQHYGPSYHPDTRPDDCRCRCDLILCPNDEMARRQQIHHPHAVCAVVGSAKTETYLASRGSRPTNPRPVVAFAWHWDSPLCKASRWAFPYWRGAVADLAADPTRGFDMIGHGHPRAWPALRRFYASCGIEAVPDAADVVARADVVVFDSTSFGFEAAAVGVPVVVLDAPWFPPCDAGWGLRFHEWADIGVNVDGGTVGELRDAIDVTLMLDPCADRRTEMSTAVYQPSVAGSAGRSVAAIRALP